MLYFLPMSTWRCKTCDRQISNNLPKPPKDKRFCPDHAATNTQPAKKSSNGRRKSKAPKKAS